MNYFDNPFYILGVSPVDDRRAIVRQAEEKALLYDSTKCSDARAILTNPQRRISAEVHWFLDCNKEEIEEIEAYISETISGKENDEFIWDQFSPITQLNVQLACLEAQNFNNSSMAKYYILGISRLFESVDSEVVLSLINKNRQQAGFPEVTKIQDIDDAVGELRTEIRQAISQKLYALPQPQYTQIVTLLSESYSGNQRYKGHAVLEDVISEYQLYINDTLAKQGQSITKTARFIARGASKIDVGRVVNDLIAGLYEWDKLAQPLQLGALTKGDSHEASVEMLRALRDLALKLHNDYDMSEESLKITKAVQEVFKELPEYNDLLNNDRKTLTRLIEEKEAEDTVGPILDAVNEACEEAKNCPENQRTEKINELIRVVENSNQQIQKALPNSSSSGSLRNSLGMLLRSFAVDLHNDLDRTEDALKIISAIEPLFSDLPELSEQIRDDKRTLADLLQEQKTTDTIRERISDITASVDSVKTSTLANRDARISTLVSKMVELDQIIKSGVSDKDARHQLRISLSKLVRSSSVELHNRHHDTERAIQLITSVKNEFSDIASVVFDINKDITMLNEQLKQAKAAAAMARLQEEKKKKSRIIWGVVAAVILLIIVISSCNSGSSKSNSSATAPRTASTPKPTVKPTSTPKPTAKPTSTPTPQSMPANGKVFYCSTTDRPSSFKVTNNGASNYYMKFVKAGTNTTVITFFVRAFSTVEIDMPAGNLELRYAYGSTWYGENKLFGEETRYAKDEEYYDFTNYSWEISLYTTYGVGESMDVEIIDADEF